ncbi:MAG: hypothetical protein BWY77_00823 [bacterium ADurb.Bin431]|nr:MAG: hypothetical protein BWY77_00823 [bacterium ADurb.Bin431]
MGIIDQGMVVDQLHEILVPGDEHGLVAAGRRRPGQGAHDVVGLVARLADEGQIEGAHKLFESGQLFGHIIGHALPLRLVFRVDLVAESGLGGIKDHGEEMTPEAEYGRRIPIVLVT